MENFKVEDLMFKKGIDKLTFQPLIIVKNNNQYYRCDFESIDDKKALEEIVTVRDMLKHILADTNKIDNYDETNSYEIHNEKWKPLKDFFNNIKE